MSAATATTRVRTVVLDRRAWEVADRVLGAAGAVAPRVPTQASLYQDQHTDDHPEVVARILAKPNPGYPRPPGACPPWDSTARRKTGATLMLDAAPEVYEGWLRKVVRQQRPAGRMADPILVNAWNEWAEGRHLEPRQKWGRVYLEATARAIGHDPALAETA